MTDEIKKKTFSENLREGLGRTFATLFLFLIALLIVVSIGGFFYFIYSILKMFRQVIPVILGFVVGFLLARLR